MSTNPRDLSSFVNYWGNRSNYQNVTIDSGIAVTGRVMPVRDIDDESDSSSSSQTARVLRGEDVAWLLESGKKIDDLLKTPNETIVNASVDSTIAKSSIDSVVLNLSTLCDGKKWIDKEVERSIDFTTKLNCIEQDRGICSLTDKNIPEFHPSRATFPALTIDYDTLLYQSGQYTTCPLSGNFIRDLFFHTSEVKFGCAQNENYVPDKGSVNVSSSSHIPGSSERDSYYLDSTKFTLKQHLSGKVKRASAYLQCNMLFNSAETTYWNYISTRSIILRVDCDVNGDEISLPFSSGVEAFNSFRSYTSMQGKYLLSTSVIVRAMMVDLDLDSDLSGIGWNYSPS